MTKDITQLGEPADVLGVADYSLIPSLMFGTGAKRFATRYLGFVANQIGFAYTAKSKGAAQLTSTNWYKVLAEPGVHIGRSNPAADPSGYQLLEMLKLAEAYYHDPSISADVLKNSPDSSVAETETSLLAALQTGQIDYLAIYRSDALEGHFRFINLPAAISLSDPALAKTYATVTVEGATGLVKGKPIIYGLTIPTNAPNPSLARQFVAFVLGPKGQSIMSANGFKVLSPALASSTARCPRRSVRSRRPGRGRPHWDDRIPGRFRPRAAVRRVPGRHVGTRRRAHRLHHPSPRAARDDVDTGEPYSRCRDDRDPGRHPVEPPGRRHHRGGCHGAGRSLRLRACSAPVPGPATSCRRSWTSRSWCRTPSRASPCCSSSGAPAGWVRSEPRWDLLLRVAVGIIVAMLFVSAPFAVNSPQGRVRVDRTGLRESSSQSRPLLPRHAFRRVTLPLSVRGILTGAVLVYARSLSEFGAVVILAFYPVTAPVEVYNLFLRTGLTESASAAVLLLAVALATFLVLRALASGWVFSGADRDRRRA